MPLSLVTPAVCTAAVRLGLLLRLPLALAAADDTLELVPWLNADRKLLVLPVGLLGSTCTAPSLCVTE
jgi:hypothetical protein